MATTPSRLWNAGLSGAAWLDDGIQTHRALPHTRRAVARAAPMSSNEVSRRELFATRTSCQRAFGAV
jgi:hypothetical protein